MRYYISNPLLALAFALLAGCGQMGPLYMPPEETPPPPAISEPVAAPTADASAEKPPKQP